jgi:hypothetical protein
MPTSAANAEKQKAPAISHAEIVRWIGEAGEAVRSTPRFEWLDFQGIDGFDVMLSQVYLTVLATLRQGPGRHVPSMHRLRDVARRAGYGAKKWAQEQRAAWQSARATTAEIVLWSRHENHSAILRPVGDALKSRGTSCHVLACQFNVFSGLKESGDTLYTLSAWPRAVYAARRDGARRARQLASFGNWTLPEFPHPNGPALEQAVRETVLTALPLVAEAIANARAVCDRLAPKVLVVGNDLTMEGRAGCRVAAQRGVPTAMFMHGTIAGDALQALHGADRLLVCGQNQHEELVARDINPARIVICGAPNLDARVRQTGRLHPALAKRFGLRAGEPWIVVATSGPGHRISPSHHEKVVASVMRLSAKFPQVPVVIKLHPKDDPAYYQDGLNRAGGARLFVVTKKERNIPWDIFEWLQGCGMLLTGASAAAVEAMLMDVPVITIDYNREIEGADFIDSGASLHVRTHDALEEAVRSVLAAGGMPADLRARVDDFLNRSFYALDGRSAERGATALCELAQSR